LGTVFLNFHVVLTQQMLDLRGLTSLEDIS